MKNKIIISILITFLFINCKTVNLGRVTDNLKPSLKLMIFQNVNEPRSIEVNTTENITKDLEVSWTKNFSFLASAQDEGGPKRIVVRVISGGKIKIIDDSSERLVNEFTVNNVVEDGLTKDKLISIGNLIFDSDQENITIQAESEDFAGNISISPIVSIIPGKEPEIISTSYQIERDFEDRVRINYQIENTENVTILAPDGSTKTRASTFDNIWFTINRSGTYKITASNNIASTSKEVNVSYSLPGSPIIESFDARPSSIINGESSVINWSVTHVGPTNNRLIGGALDITVPENGEFTVSPSSTERYELRVLGSGLTTTQFLQITVSPRSTPPPRCWTTPNPDIIGGGFTYRGLYDGLYFWDMDLSDYLSSYTRTITRIINRNDFIIRLWTGGIFIDIEPGLSAPRSDFYGLTINRMWTMEAEERIAFPAIEFCLD